jgi:gliding motility-associated-like protein
MRNLFFIISLVLLTTYSMMGQANNCGNVGFEDGTMSGWVISNGSIGNSGTIVTYTNETSGTIDNEHIITNKSNGNDPKINVESIPMVAPGSDYSIRIGSTTKGSKFDRIKKTFAITADNTLFQFKFAVILEDDSQGHASYQKPGFNVKVYDASGNDVNCSAYDIQLLTSSTVDGFKNQGLYQYRNWTTVAMDLRNYIGQNLTVEVTAHGCTRNRHFGYAYFDASCEKSEINLISSCPDANGDLTFNAPQGFEKYIWSNGATTSTTKIKAVIGDKIWVKMVPFNALNTNCDIQLDYTVEKKTATSTITKSICEGETYNFEGITYNTTGTYSKILKQLTTGCDSIVNLNLTVLPLLTDIRNINICNGEQYSSGRATYKTTGTFQERVTGNVSCDSLVIINLKVNPIAQYSQALTICEGESLKVGNMTYKTTGNYITTIKRTNQCDSIVSSALIVQPPLTISIPNDKAIIEKGENVSLNMTVSPAGTYTYLWNHGESLSCVSCINPISKPSASTTYTVVITPSNGLCPQTETASVIVSCGVWLPNAFTPNNDGMNDVFYIYSSRCIQEIKEFVIYDRWGELIFMDAHFQASDPSHGWDGLYKGKLALPDAYNYKITATYRDGETGNFTGAINVMY